MGVDDDDALYYMDKESTWKDGDGIRVEIRAIPLQDSHRSDIPAGTSYIYQLWKVYPAKQVFDILNFRFYDSKGQLLASVPSQNLSRIDIIPGGIASKVCQVFRENKSITDMSLKERVILLIQTLIGLFCSKLFGVLFGIAGWITLLLVYFAWKRGWKFWAFLPIAVEALLLYLMSSLLNIHVIVISVFVTFLILIALIIYKPKKAVVLPSFRKGQMASAIRDKASFFRASSPVLSYALAGYIGLASLIFAPYYNYVYARDNGFMRWLLFGEVVATAKAIVWPYFLLASSSSSIPRDFDECMIKYSRNTINDRSLFFIRKSCSAFSSRHESDFDKCILNNMQGINNTYTTFAVYRKCWQ